MSGKDKVFKKFRKRCYKPEGLNLKVQPMMIDRLNRLNATGLFGLNIEDTATIVLGLGIAEFERVNGPFVDLIDTRGHPNPKMLYSNSDECEEKVGDHSKRRELLAKHDALEIKRQEAYDNDDVLEEDYQVIANEVLAMRVDLGLPDPNWLAEYNQSESEEEDAEDNP